MAYEISEAEKSFAFSFGIERTNEIAMVCVGVCGVKNFLIFFAKFDENELTKAIH